MVKCSFCGEEENLPFKCNFCGLFFCSQHNLPPQHNCAGIRFWKARPSPGQIGQKKKNLFLRNCSKRGFAKETDSFIRFHGADTPSECHTVLDVFFS